MCEPSGDQRGVPLLVRKKVSWRGFEPLLSHIQISLVPDCTEAKTILLPSEKTASISRFELSKQVWWAI